MTFAFRIRFHKERSLVLDSAESSVMVRDGGPTLAASKGSTLRTTERLTLRRGEFETEDAARRERELWLEAILRAGLHLGVGLDAGTFALRSGITKAGAEYIKREFGYTVRTDVHGLDVFDDVADTRFTSASAFLSGVCPLDHLVRALSESWSSEPLESRQRIALELYGAARFADAPRIRFLTLITAIEVLATPIVRPGPTTALVENWLSSLPADVRDDASFVGRLQQLKKESIAQACRRLFLETLGPAAAADFKRLYGVRSTLVHAGRTVGSLIQDAVETEVIVRELLGKVLGSQSSAAHEAERADPPTTL